MKLTVYGIPTCDTVRKARKWLDAQGLAHAWVDFRQEPVAPAKVARWVEALGSKSLRNTSGGAYRALGPEKTQWSDADWLPRFQADPMLLKRPVLEVDGRAVAVGFQPDAWADLLGA